MSDKAGPAAAKPTPTTTDTATKAAGPTTIKVRMALVDNTERY